MRGKLVNKYINATYQEIYDLATTPDKVTIIGIRTPSGAVPQKMLSGLWKQFKAVKYNGCDFVMRATARQPLDPLQVGTSAGTQMDMRDVQNPILFRGCHGESLGTILNDLMGKGVGGHNFEGDSLDIDSAQLSADVENFYYQCLTDMSWKKSMPENGFAFNGLHPLVYNVTTNYQLNDTGGTIGIAPDTSYTSGGVPARISDGTNTVDVVTTGIQTSANGALDGRSKRWFTNELVPLGWLDTENRVGNTPTDLTPNARIPRTYMGILMMPPSYTDGVRQFFRIVITHYFTFKDFRSISLDSDYTNTPGYYDTLNLSKDAEIKLTSASVR